MTFSFRAYASYESDQTKPAQPYYYMYFLFTQIRTHTHIVEVVSRRRRRWQSEGSYARFYNNL
jgi:hypothetical protein